MISKHDNFITSPVTEILQSGISALACLGDGIENFPIQDYVLQSVFLKMTGAQEQKMRCITWVVATYDYEYRYKEVLSQPLGEFSSLTDKTKVFNALIDQLKKHTEISNIHNIVNKLIIKTKLNKIKNNLECCKSKELFRKNISFFDYNDNFFHENLYFILNDDKITLFKKKDNLADNLKPYDLVEIYDLLYMHRNRCAHNTVSFQKNLPNLRKLNKKSYEFDNYYVRFMLLILIDLIFIDLYKEYVNMIKINHYF